MRLFARTNARQANHQHNQTFLSVSWVQLESRSGGARDAATARVRSSFLIYQEFRAGRTVFSEAAAASQIAQKRSPLWLGASNRRPSWTAGAKRLLDSTIHKRPPLPICCQMWRLYESTPILTISPSSGKTPNHRGYGKAATARGSIASRWMSPVTTGGPEIRACVSLESIATIPGRRRPMTVQRTRHCVARGLSLRSIDSSAGYDRLHSGMETRRSPITGMIHIR
jgi:hypothetical protein